MKTLTIRMKDADTAEVLLGVDDTEFWPVLQIGSVDSIGSLSGRGEVPETNLVAVQSHLSFPGACFPAHVKPDAFEPCLVTSCLVGCVDAMSKGAEVAGQVVQLVAVDVVNVETFGDGTVVVLEDNTVEVGHVTAAAVTGFATAGVSVGQRPEHAGEVRPRKVVVEDQGFSDHYALSAVSLSGEGQVENWFGHDRLKISHGEHLLAGVSLG